MDKKNIAVGAAVILTLFLFAALFYQDYSNSKKIILLNENIKTLNEDISTQNVIFNQKITNVEDDLKKNKQDMISLIQATQTANQQQLQDLKKDVEESISSIQVESADFSAIIEDVLQSVVSIVTDKGQGSGVFIRTNGYIVTNEHVIRDAKSAGVLTYDQKWHKVSLIGTNTNYDIALLKIEEEYPHLNTEDSDDVKAGEKVIALGNPSGLDFTVTEGIISAVNREINNKQYLQTDVPISPGNSGGPLVNKKGNIVGINNFKISGEGFEGLGFAIPSNVVNEAVDGIMG